MFGPIIKKIRNTGHSPIEAPLWTLSCKIEANVLPYGPRFQFIYIRVEFQANHRGQIRGVIGNIMGNNVGTWGTSYESHGNTLGTHWQKKTKNSFPKTGPLLSAWWAFWLAAWNFYFHNCLSPFLAWANGKGHKMWDIVCVMVSSSIPPLGKASSKWKHRNVPWSSKRNEWTPIASEECWWTTFLKMWDLMNFALLSWLPDSFPSVMSQYNWDLIGIRGTFCWFY